MKSNEAIMIWSAEPQDSGKSAFPLPTTGPRQVAQVAVDTVARNLRDVVGKFDGMLTEIARTSSEFTLSEIEISLAVNAHGGIELIGKLEAGVEASIKVKFTRENASARKGS